MEQGNAKAALAKRNSSGLSQRLVQDLEAAQQAAQATLMSELEQSRKQKAIAEEHHRRSNEDVRPSFPFISSALRPFFRSFFHVTSLSLHILFLFFYCIQSSYAWLSSLMYRNFNKWIVFSSWNFTPTVVLIDELLCCKKHIYCVCTVPPCRES